MNHDILLIQPALRVSSAQSSRQSRKRSRQRRGALGPSQPAHNPLHRLSDGLLVCQLRLNKVVRLCVILLLRRAPIVHTVAFCIVRSTVEAADPVAAAQCGLRQPLNLSASTARRSGAISGKGGLTHPASMIAVAAQRPAEPLEPVTRTCTMTRSPAGQVNTCNQPPSRTQQRARARGFLARCCVALLST